VVRHRSIWRFSLRARVELLVRLANNSILSRCSFRTGLILQQRTPAAEAHLTGQQTNASRQRFRKALTNRSVGKVVPRKSGELDDGAALPLEPAARWFQQTLVSNTSYRIHFKPALKHLEDYEKLMATMKAGFIRQGKEGIVKSRAVEDRLYRDTWQLVGYDLLPELRTLRIPTLVIVGDHDFIPVEIAGRIARAIPTAKLVTIKDCGHFAYMECAGEVRNAFNDFFRRTRTSSRP
jgi:pimeloyl-ACP methyl ester carboxylesterase